MLDSTVWASYVAHVFVFAFCICQAWGYDMVIMPAAGYAEEWCVYLAALQT
jgi:hypothetical protein